MEITATTIELNKDSLKALDETNNPKTIGKWAGDSTQRNTYTSTYYNSVSPYNNIYAAAGLMYNFENIVFNVAGTPTTLTTGTGNAFKSDDTRNYGGFVAISNGGTAVTASNTTTGASLFRVSSLASGSVSGIRSVSLADLTGDSGSGTTFTDSRTGLFILQNYTPDAHSSAIYWLASPPLGNNIGVRNVYQNGSISINGAIGTNGLRPVISISNVKLQLKGNVWKIVK